MNIGERVGDYEVVQILGQGGMGAVYKVRNVLSERIEAMKVLLPNLENDPGLGDRFLREIKVQGAFDHPNIAKLNTAMQVGHQIVMIMEFVDGTSIEQILQQGSIPASKGIDYAAQVLNALTYAHQLGVVHRDIKPANIMVTPGGVVKLMDFGIARMKADQRLTNAGGTVGSLLYMSPEQIKGVELDGRADIYSLGITLYEMVTGRRPFTADSDFQLMSAHLMQAPVAPMEVIPGVPQDLNDIILMAIAKDPEQRFQSAAAFRGALSSVGAELAAPVSSNPLGANPLGARTKTIQHPVVVTPPPMHTPHPVYTPPVLVPVNSRSSRRGMYMALGSLATIAVLAVAVIEGPKLFRGGSSGAAAKTSEAMPSPEVPPVVPPVVSPVVPAEKPPEKPLQTGGTQTSIAASIPGGIRGGLPAESTPRELPARPRQKLTPTNIVAPALAPPVLTHAAPRETAQNQVPAVPTPVQTQPAPSRPAASPELNEVRERYNQLSIKAAALKDGVNTMQQNLARQGLSLRADVQAAKLAVDYQLQEAMQSIRAGDVDAAKQSLTYGEGSAAKLAKFLGQ